jgi:hypothetical protein
LDFPGRDDPDVDAADVAEERAEVPGWAVRVDLRLTEYRLPRCAASSRLSTYEMRRNAFHWNDEDKVYQLLGPFTHNRC